MAVYQGARPRAIGAARDGASAPRTPAGAGARARRRVRRRRPRRAARDRAGLGALLGGDRRRVHARVLLAGPDVRVAATSYDIDRLQFERERLDARRQELRSDLNRLGPRAGDPQAWRSTRASASSASRSSSRPADARSTDRCSVGPIPAAACSSCSCFVGRRRSPSSRGSRYWQVAAARRARRRGAPRRRRSRLDVAEPARRRSTTGPGPSCWRRPSTATGSSRRPTS